MRRYLLAAITAAVTVTAAGCVQAGAAVPGGRAAGSELWTAHLRTVTNTLSDAIAVSPHGGMVFVTGESYLGRADGAGYHTMAYRAATGRRLWASRYHGPTKGQDTPDAMTVSPDGTTVFVTGYSPSRGTGEDFATVAYRAATGKQLWASRYNSPAHGYYAAKAVAMSPDGTAVYVTGMSRSTRGAGFNYATVAYNATTGNQLWASRYGPAKELGGAESIAVSPSGGRVFVTGRSFPRTSDPIYATVAYSAATGRQMWASRYGPGKVFNDANSVAVSPEGTSVFVTGTSDSDFATIAYNAATGRQLWTGRDHGPGAGFGSADWIVASPDGSTVFVTGWTQVSTTRSEYLTIAYRS